jgi:hypothetical protein
MSDDDADADAGDLDRPGGPIAPWCEHDLYDVLEADIPPGESTEYVGLHLIAGDGSRFTIQPDGYAGTLTQIDVADYDDVLELVDELNTWLVEWREVLSTDDDERIVEYGGKQITSDEAKAQRNPEKYLYVPDDPEPPDSEGVA